MPPKKYNYWEWKADDGKFKPFDKPTSMVLEDAFKQQAPTAAVTIKKDTYTIDLTHMTQTNDTTKTVRSIRRVAKGEAPTTHAVWEWEQHHGKGDFTPYDPATSAKIDDAFNQDALVLNLGTVPISAHDTADISIHFGYMHQKNANSDVTRTVRRSMKAGPAPAIPAASVAAAAVCPSTVPAKTVPTAGVKRARSPPAAAAAADGAAVHPAANASAATFVAKTLKDWSKVDSMLYIDHGITAATAALEEKHHRSWIAAFDMDDTLVCSPTGKVFPNGRSDWRWLHPSVEPKLRALSNEGYRIVIFTNQMGIAKKAWDESKANEIRGKIVDIAASIKVPISAWVSTTEDKYRKPGLGMWEHFTSTLPHPVDFTKSFYCGDAAGRHILTMANRKKDFSCGDRKFSMNCGLPFYTPEEYFLGAKGQNDNINWDGISPDALASIPNTYPCTSYHGSGQEMVMMVGFPGSGKSTFFRRFFAPHNYVHINRDTLKTAEKCLAAATDAVNNGQSVVVDNTNPSPEDRKPYLALAAKRGIPVRCMHFTADEHMSNHMNIMRDRLGITSRVSSIVYNIFKGKFKPPTVAEGFAAVVAIPPVANFDGLPAAAKTLFHLLS